jgi:Uma2 family endonuclease
MATVTEANAATAMEAPAPTTGAEPEGLYEVIDGQIVEKPPMGAFEVAIASRLHVSMGHLAQSEGLGQVFGEMLFRIDPEERLDLRPDVAFVSNQTWPIERRVPRTAAWEVVPDLAIEVISPNNKTVEDIGKVDGYFRAGTRAVWLIFPTLAKVYVYESPTSVKVLALGDELDGGAVLPGFRLALANLLGEPAG